MASGPNFVLDKGFLTTGTDAYEFGETVVQTSESSVAHATSAGARVIGIMQENLDADAVRTGNAAGDVRVLGISRAIAAGAVAVGDLLASDANSHVAVAGTGNVIIGVAMSAVSNPGDHVDVLLTPGSGTSA